MRDAARAAAAAPVLSRPLAVLGALLALALASVAAFMLWGARGDWSFVLAFRGRRLLVLVTVAYAVAVSTVLFQTATANRILSPSIMGFDALYVLARTVVAFAAGSALPVGGDPQTRFLVDVALMVGFSWALFRWLFLGGERGLHLLVLVGLVSGVLFRSLAAFLQRLLDPNSFQVLQDTLFARFSNVDGAPLALSLALVLAASLVLLRIGHTFDVLALGRATATGLGVEVRRTVRTILMAVAVLVAVSTALVGPVGFLGLLVASLARAVLPESRHRFLLPAAVLLAVVALVGGQTVLERALGFDSALSVVVEFLGGLVFILLLVRGATR